MTTRAVIREIARIFRQEARLNRRRQRVALHQSDVLHDERVRHRLKRLQERLSK